RLIASPQGGRIDVVDGAGTRQLVNLCSNNYLGLADHPDIVAAAKAALDEFGFGLASVRFICGAQTLHRNLEHAIARYLGKDDAILFAA
ncbi:aminotransferase class I/II-fold pyridoxal phosphate-dependent enzyme, partial [Acinetobacter baumannii]